MHRHEIHSQWNLFFVSVGVNNLECNCSILINLLFHLLIYQRVCFNCKLGAQDAGACLYRTAYVCRYIKIVRMQMGMSVPVLILLHVQSEDYNYLLLGLYLLCIVCVWVKRLQDKVQCTFYCHWRVNFLVSKPTRCASFCQSWAQFVPLPSSPRLVSLYPNWCVVTHFVRAGHNLFR